MNVYATYQKQAFATAPPEEILLKLYEGAILRVKSALQNWDQGYKGQVWEKINQTVAIIAELDNTLDRKNGDPQLVDELHALYRFMLRELNFCALRQDRARLQNVLDVLQTLNTGWEGAAQELKKQGCKNHALAATL
ncbi:MAG: flagellar export chaperone FliS [Desulfohalobiaceae bacterium]